MDIYVVRNVELAVNHAITCLAVFIQQKTQVKRLELNYQYSNCFFKGRIKAIYGLVLFLKDLLMIFKCKFLMLKTF